MVMVVDDLRFTLPAPDLTARKTVIKVDLYDGQVEP
jgi:hypothetical protein